MKALKKYPMDKSIFSKLQNQEGTLSTGFIKLLEKNP